MLSPEPDFDLHMAVLAELLEKCLDPFTSRKTATEAKVPQTLLSEMIIPSSCQKFIILQSLFIAGTPGSDIGLRRMAIRVICAIIERIGRASKLRQSLNGKLGSDAHHPQCEKEEFMFQKMELEWQECHSLIKILMYSVMTTIRLLIKSDDTQVNRSSIEALSHIVRVFGPVQEFLPSPTKLTSFFDSPQNHPNYQLDQQRITSRFHLDLFSLIKFSSESKGKKRKI